VLEPIGGGLVPPPPPASAGHHARVTPSRSSSTSAWVCRSRAVPALPPHCRELSV